MTKEVKFTPGPWKAWQPRGDESVPVRTDGMGITIAYVHQGAITDAQANARLIAAAPELLEALEAMLDEHDDGHGISHSTANMAMDVIAKALGHD